MIKAILYKEWIKTRYLFLLAAVILVTFTAYCQLRISKVVSLRGTAHLWEILLTRDHTFYETMRYVPLFSGILLALFQFIPEMLQKRLKLCLHLPLAQNKIIGIMLGFGVSLLVTLFVITYLIIFLYLNRILASELTTRIMLTMLPWFIAGIAGYAFVAFTVLEPTWRHRLLNVLAGIAFIRIFFLSSYAEAYNQVIVWLLIITFVLVGLSFLSVSRFKDGIQ
jgi:hypothetical protein